MERTAVQSRDIAIVGYDRETSTLEVTFRRGGVYVYDQVPRDTYAGLMAAPSCGTFFNQNIKDKFSCKKVR